MYMTIKSINTNKADNLGLVNRHKIKLCLLSAVLHFVFKNNVRSTSYTSFQPSKEKFIYIKEVSGREITCGVTLLSMAMRFVKPQLAIDHMSKERELEELALAKLGNNVRNYLIKM